MLYEFEEELNLDVAVACIGRSASGTPQDILAHYAQLTRSTAIDPYSTDGRQFQRDHGITPQEHGALQHRMDAENIQEFSQAMPRYFSTLISRGLVARLTDSGIEYYNRLYPTEPL